MPREAPVFHTQFSNSNYGIRIRWFLIFYLSVKCYRSPNRRLEFLSVLYICFINSIILAKGVIPQVEHIHEFIIFVVVLIHPFRGILTVSIKNGGMVFQVTV